MRRTDRVIETLAARQHGVVSRAQLREAGIPVHAVDHRVKIGDLRPVQRGVYQVGALATPRASEMAAVLACGAGAAVSHGSAARLWGLLRARRTRSPVDVTVPRHRRRRPGVRVHCAGDLMPADVTRLDAIPITTPARTILDLAGEVDTRALEQVVARADREGLATHSELSSLSGRCPRREGPRRLAVLLAGADGPALTRSEAEERFLALIRKARLPSPESNIRIVGHEVDFLWRGPGVVVEVDGFRFHSCRSSFEADRRRDADLSAAGLRVLRVTWRQILEEGEATLVRIAQMIAMSLSPADFLASVSTDTVR